MPASTSSNAIPVYFVVMRDLGRLGREAVVDPEMTRAAVIDRIRSREYRDVLFIQFVHDGVAEDVTDELTREAEATREAPELMKQFDAAIGAVKTWMEAA